MSNPVHQYIRLNFLKDPSHGFLVDMTVAQAKGLRDQIHALIDDAEECLYEHKHHGTHPHPNRPFGVYSDIILAGRPWGVLDVQSYAPGIHPPVRHEHHLATPAPLTPSTRPPQGS